MGTQPRNKISWQVLVGIVAMIVFLVTYALIPHQTGKLIFGGTVMVGAIVALVVQHTRSSKQPPNDIDL